MKIGIVIQGPYIVNYTNKIIEYYHSILKNKYEYLLCLSTWEEDISQDTIECLEKLKIELVLNKKPSISGHQNINFQIVSTLNGLKVLKEKGCKVAIKVRTDFKWNLTYFIDYYLQKNENKICCMESCDDLIGYPLVINDFIFISNIKNLIDFFNVPLSEYGHDSKIKHLVSKNISQYKQVLINQMYIYYSNRHNYKQYELFAEPYFVKKYLELQGNILPRNKVLLYYHSVLLMTLYFDLLVWDKDKMGGGNVKNHYLPSIGKFNQYKKMIKKKQFIRLWLKAFFRVFFIDNLIRVKYQIRFLLHTIKYSFFEYKF